MKNLVTKILLPLTLLLFPILATSQTTPGQENTVFKTALDSWLQGDDEVALGQISELAKNGNQAARLFLGSIEQYTYLHDRVTGPKDRKTRIALLRDPKGLSGQSWLKVLAEDLPVAQGLLQARQIKERERGIELLFEAAHDRQIFENLPAVLENGNYNFAIAVALNERLKPVAGPLASFIYFDLKRRGTPTANLAGLRAGIDADPQMSDATIAAWLQSKPLYDQLVRSTDGVEAAMAELPQMAAAKRLCETVCPEDVTNCVADINATATKPIGLVSMSPAESLIPTKTYRASPRLDDDLRRYLKTTLIFRPDLRLSQCKFQHLFLNSG